MENLFQWTSFSANGKMGYGRGTGEEGMEQTLKTFPGLP